MVEDGLDGLDDKIKRFLKSWYLEISWGSEAQFRQRDIVYDWGGLWSNVDVNKDVEKKVKSTYIHVHYQYIQLIRLLMPGLHHNASRTSTMTIKSYFDLDYIAHALHFIEISKSHVFVCKFWELPFQILLPSLNTFVQTILFE